MKLSYIKNTMGLIKPGLMFQAAPIISDAAGPKDRVTYVVCQNGSIQNLYEPDACVEWELLEDENGWYYRTSETKPCAVFFRGYADQVPTGRRLPRLSCRTKTQDAEVSEQDDNGEEVTSTPPPTPRGEPVCPGAPRKSDIEKIARFDPLLADVTEMVGDPLQADALAKFVEGNLSYAEMRMLCG